MIAPKPRLPRRKAVTFIVGFECYDGMVLCSESQEGDGYNKRYLYKLRSRDINGQWGIGFGCAGSSPAINRFTDKFRELLGYDAYDRYKTESIIEQALRYMQEQYPQDGLEIIAGIWGPTETRLYRSFQTTHCISVENGYACIGMDVSLAKVIIESIFDESMGVDEALRLGVFVTTMAKECLDGCGGPIRAKVYRTGMGAWQDIPDDYLVKVEREFPPEEFYGSIFQYWKGKKLNV